MTARKLRWFALVLVPLTSLLSPACDDAEGDCPAGHEGCVCTEDYECLEGLQCLSDYCVDPNSGSGADSNGSGGSPTGNGSGNGGNDNVAACESFVDSIDCAFPGGAPPIDCAIYGESVCDITDYLACLESNTSCNNDMLDASGWIDCVSLVEDCQ